MSEHSNDALKALYIGTSVHYVPSHHFTAHRSNAAELPATDEVWQQPVSPLYRFEQAFRAWCRRSYDAIAPHLR